MDTRLSIWSFAAAFRRQWFAAMSGAFSVPFAALAVILDNKYAQPIFGFLAFSSTWFAAYRIWRAERENGLLLEAKVKKRPRLKLSFSMEDPGCVRRNTILSQPDPFNAAQRIEVACDWYRLRVEAEGDKIVSGCHGRLLSIQRGETSVLAGETPTLPFAPSENADATSKTIYPGAPEYLDLFAITEDNRVLLALDGFKGSNSVNWGGMFDFASDYSFDVVVLSPDSISLKARLLFRWSLRRTSSEVILQESVVETKH